MRSAPIRGSILGEAATADTPMGADPQVDSFNEPPDMGQLTHSRAATTYALVSNQMYGNSTIR